MVKSDIQKLDAGSIVELFELDATTIGGDVYYLHNGVNELGSDVVFGGITYNRFPIFAEGFETTGQGSLPRPVLKVANVTGILGALVKEFNDLVNTKITRIRTFVKYLDAVNFTGGVNPEADPNQVIDREVWNIDRKSSENKVFIEFELAAAWDVQGVMLPKRQIIQNVCPWKYRSAECSYTGPAVADKNDQLTTDISKDSCGKRLSSCKLRFGRYGILPYGGFPAAGLIR